MDTTLSSKSEFGELFSSGLYKVKIKTGKKIGEIFAELSTATEIAEETLRSWQYNNPQLKKLDDAIEIIAFELMKQAKELNEGNWLEEFTTLAHCENAHLVRINF